LPTLLATLLGATGAAYVAVTMPDAYRASLAVAIGLNLIVLGMKWPRAAALATILFLPFLGLVRRLLIFETGWSANDPLVVVGPGVALFLFYRLYVLEERKLGTDLLSKLVLGLLALELVQLVNPLAGGGVLANLGGLIFLGVPLLWFFVGRAVGDARSVAFLVRASIVVAAIVALYGLFQTEWAAGERLPSWDQEWFEVAGYAALKVADSADANNTVRAFSTFPSNGEYSNYLAFALVFIFAIVLHRRSWPLLIVPLLLVAVFYSGGRATMALAGMAIVVLTGMRTRNGVAATLVIVAGVASVFALASLLGPRLDQAAGVSGDAIASRNVQGFLNPLDPSGSGVARWANFVGGIEDGFRNPAGRGTGASNAAGSKLSDSSKGTRETDNDISDVFLSLGAVGGIAYIAIIVLVFRTVFRRYMRTSSWLLFAIMGALIVMFGNWLNGGMYALSALTWFLIGWATRPDLDLPRPRGEAAEDRDAPRAVPPAQAPA
jgi:hypothetical protein